MQPLNIIVTYIIKDGLKVEKSINHFTHDEEMFSNEEVPIMDDSI